ncbi:MAG: 50S ribosomal protein L4 [Pseudomonadota bacterium]
MQFNTFDKNTSIDVSDAVFAREFNEGLVHQVVTACLAAKRAGTATQKTRAEVTASGRKPWRQKGTGNARSGTVTSPIWRSGGVTFASKPRSYKQKVNKKMYKAAMCVMLSELARQDRLLVAEEFTVEEAKTKVLATRLSELESKNVLIAVENFDHDDVAYQNLSRAAANLPNVQVLRAADIAPVALLSHQKILVTVGAIRKLEERLA